MNIIKSIIKQSVSIAISVAMTAAPVKEETTIRVLLMTTGYGGYFHDTVEYVEHPEEGTFQILSIERECGNPEYKGTLEVKETEQGYLLINEVPLEDYVKGVVPGEMPSSYEMEALKVQAICARTYACRQKKEKRLEAYGADVDDSVNFQVYNNQKRTDKTDQAADETKGMIMTYEGEPIQAYFFSTSSGATSTDEVWLEDSAPCLKSIVTNYDEAMPWYRWNVIFTAEQVQDLLESKGYSIGEVKDINVLRKSQGGAVTVCRFTGTNDSATIENEYNIREILSPKGLQIHRQDGTVVDDFLLLPSAYFDIEKHVQEKGNTVFTIYGGGYGHGVGLSQNGANEMAKQGFECYDILNYYYKDFQMVKNVSFDH